MKSIFYKIFFALFLICNASYAQQVDISGNEVNSLSNILNKKKDFYTFTINDEEYPVNPYIGIGYAFSIAKFTDNGNSYNKSVPNMFNNVYFLVGTKIGDNLLFEIGGTTGLVSVSGNSNARLNAIHFNIGWMFGEELLGEYGEKNKFIVLAGFILGITSASVNGVNIANNYVSVAPELGLAYQRFITDRISIRFDVRMSSLQIYQTQGSIMGTFMGTVLFHL